MKVLLRGVHLKLTDSIRAYVDEHLVSHLERFAEDEAAEIDISLVDVNGPKGGVDKECRATVSLPNLPIVHVTEAGETLFQAIDATRDRLERALQRTVDRRRDTPSEGLPQDLAANVPTY
ncbi:ribosome-associated translation inhibitor RaiA [Corallococcus sp. H22C18031201]|uniref:ribosome hibernation-promoting factor, HPF/YfiA family n=1 Tax=Citreicoccus inhibens TaxID=2849499 RepID=UPI000E70D327|nr:ribosome-associated translation inhibitor RaiA [Citreicoccus inhibens]MBU8898389.1 ribosome-associated translation inhibitor RaiA [Citreicoccus inhibens]RJS15412.1 ribosome-associated translation inhibitor RaiA [Corallococcus sp. H22C18031201]